jgi:hypothetical protein
MAATKCGIIRDFASADCSGAAGGSSALCRIPGAANFRMALFGTPPVPGDIVRAQIRRNYLAGIAKTETDLAQLYPQALPEAVRISWPDFELCRWNEDGSPGGLYGNRYFGRADLTGLGMAPSYPVGGQTLAGRIWRGPSPIPTAVDYVSNPDFATVVFVLLVVISILVAALPTAQKTVSPHAPSLVGSA